MRSKEITRDVLHVYVERVDAATSRKETKWGGAERSGFLIEGDIPPTARHPDAMNVEMGFKVGVADHVV